MIQLTEAQKANREAQYKEVTSAHSALRERMIERHSFDPDTINWDAAKTDRKFWKKMEEAFDTPLREANASSALGQLMRYGVQQFMFDAYKDVPTMYQDVVKIVPSDGRQEWYAPLYGAEIPLDVVAGAPYEDSRLSGLDTVLVNKKVGRILGVQKEAFDDDQTGQIAERAGRLGKRVRYKEEFDVMGAIRGATYNTTIGNAPAANTTLSQPALETADIALQSIRDPLGNRMGIDPNFLLVSTKDKFSAAKLLNSSLQPSVPGASGETISSAASGGTGWTMAMNPLQGLYQLGVSRFLGDNDWFLMEAKTAVPFQERAPLSVVQEDPNSGQSFERDIYRWKVSRRYNSTVLESRYIYAGYVNATAPLI